MKKHPPRLDNTVDMATDLIRKCNKLVARGDIILQFVFSETDFQFYAEGKWNPDIPTDMQIPEDGIVFRFTQNGTVPFKSENQRRFMWAKHPEIAHKWAHGKHSKKKPPHRMPKRKSRKNGRG
jgi:hypothetical protein